jgi:uncharacterized protein (TIGR01319 family)
VCPWIRFNKEIEEAKCDIILLSGGTDGGDKRTILHNAAMLADSKINCPVLAAGNRAAAGKVKSILDNKNEIVYISKNVLPSLDVVDVGPAQTIIREIFLAHILKAKGLDKAQERIGTIQRRRSQVGNLWTGSDARPTTARD